MTNASELTKNLAQRLGFLDPLRRHAAEIVRTERQIAKVTIKVDELTRMVEALDARLLDRRAEQARLHYGARQAARHGSEPRALRYLSNKRQAEERVRELEDEVAAGRRLLKQAVAQRDALVEGLDTLRRAFQASRIVSLADDVSKQTPPPSTAARLAHARQQLLTAEAMAEVEAPKDPFADLPELGDPEDRLLLARWRSQDRAAA